MNKVRAGIIGGLAAGLATSLLMALGRRSGLLHQTLAEDAEDWLDRTAASRHHLGEGGTRALEQASHLTTAAGFGAGYTLLRDQVPALPAWLLGALYGSGLYAVNIAGIAPLIHLTEGELKAPAPLRAERLGLHLFYGVATAVIAEGLSDERQRR